MVAVPRRYPTLNTSRNASPSDALYGDEWKFVLSQVKPRPLPVARAEIPTDPGIYIWFRDDQPIYVGEGLGAKGLRRRLSSHFSKSADLSRSTLRASVAVVQLGIDRSVARQRPSLVNADQVAAINHWLASCELGWLAFEDPDEAHALEVRLRDEWLPPLNLV